MSAIILGNSIIHYEVIGRGKPVIFLHSWCGSWRYWVPAMQMISASFRAYAIDLWGFGDTAKDPSQYILDQQVDLLYGFLYQMGIGKIAVIGHGFGAIVGLRFAHKYKDLVERIMVVEYPLTTSNINNRLRSYTPVELASWLLGRTGKLDELKSEINKTDHSCVQVSYDELATVKLDQLLSQISRPCLCVYSINDPLIETPGQDVFTELPDFSHVMFFDQSGHFPMLEETNRFNRLLFDFLSLAPGENPRNIMLKDEWIRKVR